MQKYPVYTGYFCCFTIFANLFAMANRLAKAIGEIKEK
jgi:hypothetical protein